MHKTFHSCFLLLPAFLSLSCGGLARNMAVSTTGDIMYEAAPEMESEKNWEVFKNGLPGNLKMMEGLLWNDPQNLNLLAGLTKGYVGLAFGVDETLALEDLIIENDNSPARDQAIANYSKGLEYGLRFLAAKKLTLEELTQGLRAEGGFGSFLDKELSDDSRNLQTVLFTGNALASLINLKKNDMRLVGLLPLAKGLFDWVCVKQPDINFGSCDLFQAAYALSRPKMLGGDPEKGKAKFLEALKKYPQNSLIRASYIQYALWPEGDKAGIKREFAALEEDLKLQKEALTWSPKKGQALEVPPGLWLYRSIGLKRYQIFKKHEKKLI